MTKRIYFLAVAVAAAMMTGGCGGSHGNPEPIEELVNKYKPIKRPALDAVREDFFQERKRNLEQNLSDTGAPIALKDLLTGLFSPYRKTRTAALADIVAGQLTEKDLHYFLPNRYQVKVIKGFFTQTKSSELLAILTSEPAKETFIVFAVYNAAGVRQGGGVDFSKEKVVSYELQDVTGDGDTEIITRGIGSSSRGLSQRWANVLKYNPERQAFTSVWSGSEYKKVVVPLDKHGRSFEERNKLVITPEKGLIQLVGERTFKSPDGQPQQETVNSSYRWKAQIFSYQPLSE